MEIAATLAARSYARDLDTLRPAGAEEGGSFAAIAAEFRERLDAADQTARAAMLGQTDPHRLIEVLASTQSAVETVAAVRDRVVEAYQEILRMPV